MLQSINQTAKKFVAAPLALLLILSFIAWGVADVFSGQTAQDTVLTAGSVELNGQHVQGEVQKNLDFLRRLTNKRMTMDDAQDLGLVDRAINSLVSRALIEQEAQRLGIVISDEVIMETVRHIPDFQKPEGGFDAAKFRQALMTINASEQMFLIDQRIALARDQVEDVVKSATHVPALMLRALASAAAEQRTFETYQVKFAAQKVDKTPTDEELQAYVQENTATFSVPESRTISYIHLTPDAIAKDITIPDTQAEEYYKANQNEFTVPERRTFDQAVVPDKEAAEKVVAAFKSGKSLAAAAKAAGGAVSTLSNIGAGELPEELRGPAFSMKKGEVATPVESMLGWHVLVVTKITDGSTKSYADAKADILARMKTEQAGERLFDETARLDDLLASGASLTEVADDMGLAAVKVDSIDATGRDAAGKPIADLPSPELLVKTAFALGEGESSNLISTGKDGYVVVQVAHITPTQLPPFMSIRDTARAAWLANEREMAGIAAAGIVQQDLRAGASFDDVARKYGVESSIEKNIVQKDGAAIQYIPADYTDKLFLLDENGTTQVPVAGGIVVVRYMGGTLPVAVADAKPDANAGDKVLDDMRTARADAYVEGLKERYTVRIDRPAIDQLFAKKDEE